MEQGLLTKSKFFIEAFNTAIIDGPLRIYFSDKQESEALHIYFEIQENLAQQGLQLTQLASSCTHAFVMLYPDETAFLQVFENNKPNEYVIDQFGENVILGLKASPQKEQRQVVSQKVSQIIQSTVVL
ncbi:MAG: hypothetical protein IPM57_11320 [Oligoflexia bacterium]|nr:hypothetical protein [Oligoflexia bacterium]